MTRLAELESMRRRVDDEIDKERQQLWAMARLRDEVDDLLMKLSTTEAQIFTAVAQYFEVTEVQIVSESRDQLVMKARHVVCWLLRDHGMSYPAIGKALGGRDHSTAINSVRRVQESADLGKHADAVRERIRAAAPAVAS